MQQHTLQPSRLTLNLPIQLNPVSVSSFSRDYFKYLLNFDLISTAYPQEAYPAEAAYPAEPEYPQPGECCFCVKEIGSTNSLKSNE
jgi:hypothetical protein